MRNLFDFYDCCNNWRNNMVNHKPENVLAEEDWFFPGVDFSEKVDLIALMHRERFPEPVVPSIQIQGVRIVGHTCEPAEISICLADFDSWEKLADFMRGGWIYFSVMDCDGCDFELANECISSEEAFDEIMYQYKRQL